MIWWKSPAKVNLFLKVLGKREDGYHELATLMQTLSLYDEIGFKRSSRGISLKCSETALPDDERNIVFRAADSIISRFCPGQGIEIELKKRIPLAAGLGGGSSNAAVTLLAINELFGLSRSREDLAKMAVRLGADVPFFIYGKAAWAFGVGDRVEPLTGLPEMSFVLVNPGFEVSTRTVYENLRLPLTNQAFEFNIPHFETVGEISRGLQNDLERVTFRLHPELTQFKESLIRLGALGALMSGSGPTIFGIFKNEQGAREAASQLRRQGPWPVFTAHSL